mgnify:CR=1 FL=1
MLCKSNILNVILVMVLVGILIMDSSPFTKITISGILTLLVITCYYNNNTICEFFDHMYLNDEDINILSQVMPKNFNKDPTKVDFINNHSVIQNFTKDDYNPLKALKGEPNPLTHITPVITPPAFETGHWKTNSFSGVVTGVNAPRLEYETSSGYLVNTPYAFKPVEHKTPITKDSCVPVKYQHTPSDYFVKPKIIEKFGRTYHERAPQDEAECQYEVLNTEYDTLLANSRNVDPEKTLNYQRLNDVEYLRPEMDVEHNKNINVHQIDVDKYFTSDIHEPINANLGISYKNPQYEIGNYEDNTMFKEYVDNEITHTVKNLNHDLTKYMDYSSRKNRYNTYDPRHTGYGDNTRHYVDRVTGQPRFFYADVDHIALPKEIKRNNYNVYDKMTNDNLMDVKAHMRQQFLDSSTQFRNDLQTIGMRKNFRISTEKRKFPKYT